jgi:hypothetical protein
MVLPGRRLVAMLVLVGLWLALPTRADAQAAPVVRFALVIGNNRAPDIESLRYADDDALGMHQLFLDANVDSRLIASFDAATRELHPNVAPKGPATLAELEREMAAVRARMRSLRARGVSTEFYFFFSGHGDVEGGEGRLMLEDHALTRGELYELLEASGASYNHVLLDACSSFLVAAKRADAQRREPVDPGFALRQTPDELGNVGFVLSSSSDRDSHEWERYEAGIVSHELRSGLRGAADADLDGRISYAELAAFLQRANQAIDIPRLRPDPFVVPPGRHDWQRPVLSWSTQTVSVRVRGGATGHFFVENARGERLLDAHPSRDQWLHLHLPGDRPLFIRGHDRPAEYEVAGSAPAEVSMLEPVASALRRAKGAEQLALQRLFAAPFGRSQVLEFERRLRLAPPSAEPAFDDTRSPWLRPLGYTALGAAAVGGGLSALALVTYRNARDAAQLEADRANRRIARYHVLSIVPYATAATAGLLWGWLKLGADDRGSAGLRLTPALAGGDVWLGVDGRF